MSVVVKKQPYGPVFSLEHCVDFNLISTRIGYVGSLMTALLTLGG